MDVQEEIIEEGLIWRDEQGGWCSRLFPLMVFILCFGTLLAIPFKVLESGYLPPDDALRHAGFALVDKTWDQVLVSEAPIPDVHVGWHETLKFLHEFGGLNGDELVVFSVAFLALIWLLPPLFMHKRPESWMLAFVLVSFFAGPGQRLLLGRPYVAHVATLTWVLLLGGVLNQRKLSWPCVVSLTGLMSISIWWRTTWFLYALPMVSFLFARHWRAFFRLGVIVLVATLCASMLAGNPLLAWESLSLSFSVMGSAPHSSQLVSELQPMISFAIPILSLSGLALVVKALGGSPKRVFDSPAFYMFVLALVLGCSSRRWWIDFGIPSMVVLFSMTIDYVLAEKGGEGTRFAWLGASRFGMVFLICVTLFLSYTSDIGGRWSNSLRNEYVDVMDESIQEGLPGSGGVIYNIDMSVFYQTFFKYPQADWRYLLGYESAFMPEEDLTTYRNIQWNRRAWAAFDPWAEKLRPEDRIWIVQGIGAGAPKISDLQWTQMTSYIWSGRKALDD